MSDVFDGDFAYLEKENERLLAENQRLRKMIERIDNVRRSDGSRVYKLAQIGEIAREALAGDAE